MNRPKRWAAAAGLALGTLTLLVAVPAAGQAGAPAVDPAAVKRLKEMTDFVDGLPQFSLSTQNTIEEVLSGHRVDYDMAARVIIKRPNKLLAVRTGEWMNQSFFYDGKTLTLYNPAAKVYATHAAPGTVEGAIDLARETIGITLPAVDLVYRGAYPLMTQGLTFAKVVGKAVVGGARCDHLLFSHPGADFQVWVEEGSRPWPRKYVVTETDTPARLSTTTVASDWNESPVVTDSQFAFVPPQGTSQTKFLPPGSN
jgi:hypothetical protein